MSFVQASTGIGDETITFLSETYHKCLCIYDGRLFRYQFDQFHYTRVYFVRVVPIDNPHPFTGVKWETNKYNELYYYNQYNILDSPNGLHGTLNPFVQTWSRGEQINVWGNAIVRKLQRWGRRMIRERRERRLAMCMGMHKRLGAHSMLYTLPPEVAVKILV